MSSSDVVEILPFVVKWLYTRKDKFKIVDLFEEFGIAYTKEGADLCSAFINFNSLAFKLGINTPYWIGKDVFFTDKVFAIKPTQYELGNGLLIPGSRFDPYLNNLFEHMDISLLFNEKELYTKLVALPFSEIKKYYYLYSEEAILSKLASSPMNKQIEEGERNVKPDDFFYIPAYNIRQIYQNWNFREDEQLIFKISSWAARAVEFYSKTKDAPPINYKKDWIANFEKALPVALLEVATEYTDIANVLSSTLFLGRDVLLNSDYCLPLQDYLLENDRLVEISVGLKDVKWPKTHTYPSRKEWFGYVLNLFYIVNRRSVDEQFFISIHSPMTEAIMQIFVYSFIDNNYIRISQNTKKYRKECIDAFIKDFFSAEKYKEHIKKISHIMGKKYSKYIKQYNPFKKKEELALAFAMFSLFRRVYASIAILEKSTIMPFDIQYDISIIIIQMVMEMDNSLFNLKQILDGRPFPNTKEFLVVTKDLIERFSFITTGFEEFVLSHFKK